MNLAIINLNDAGVQVALDGDLISTSPGYAVLDGKQLYTGSKASECSRLLPRWTNNRFWSQLSTNPIQNKTAQIRHHADIALSHLEAMWQEINSTSPNVVFAVPGYYGSEHLGLLLGIAREVGIETKGVVDQSILAAANLPCRSVVLHLEIHLHSITLTRIENSGQLQRKSVTTVAETGLFTLWDRWANIIAEQFIQTTRFDPMHDAAIEQVLFDQLPGWIASHPGGSRAFDLSAGQTEHSVTVSADSLTKACASIYPQIVQSIRSELNGGDSATLLISHRFDGFPGLAESLALIPEVEVQTVSEKKIVSSGNLHKDELISDSGAISHILQISAGELLEASVATARTSRPSHLLWNNEARAIGRAFKLGTNFEQGLQQSNNPVCTIYPRGEDLVFDRNAESNLTINGRAADESGKLVAGDELVVDGERVQLITVLSDG